MKTVNSEQKYHNCGNDPLPYFICGVCSNKHFLKLLFIQNRVRFKINEISPVFDEICIDCPHCGMTTFHIGEHAYSIMKLYFNTVNPEYIKLLNIPNVVRMSKEYFDFIKVIS